MITRLQETCPTCSKVVTLKEEFTLGEEKFLTFTCNHVVIRKLEKSAREKLSILSNNLGQKLYPFQVEAAEFARSSNFRCLLNLDTGTGKTVITTALLGIHSDSITPTLIVCKSSLRTHWKKTIQNWTGLDCQIIETSGEMPLPFLFPVVIISYDLLTRIDEPSLFSEFKSLIIDETQSIKSQSAKRTHALRKVAALIPHIIGCSATPIKNHAGEYYTILNMLRPDMFRNYNSFVRYYVDTYSNGGYTKFGGLKNRDYFFRVTREFIIRMKREEVLPNLPKINRTYLYTDLEASVKKAYLKELDSFSDAYESGEFNGPSGFTSIIEYLTKMRHLTGISKVRQTVEYSVKFLQDNPEEKLVIFVHHHDVSTLLEQAFLQYHDEEENGNSLKIFPTIMDANSLSKNGQGVVDSFINSKESRVAIVSTIAGGEGLNFQPISNCILMERQWNPANEEQAESRFPRPGATAEVINVKYITAVGTIDEYFAELVERKRSFSAGAVDNQTINWQESSIIRELADILYKQGKKSWTWK